MLPPIDFKDWINRNRNLLKPPVCNKVVYEDTEFIIMVVGGPNTRKDFHVDEGEEFFYQIEGDMVLNIFKNNKIENIRIKEGNIFLLPPRVPHSPQRFENTVGLVIERKRRDNELDGFQWYCDSCNHLLYEKFFKLENIETQLPVIFEKFWSNDEARTCNNCKEYLEKP
tara:strand:- start:543 stop:1049 length:507 start_codon:yes stop_codon:yes gene_type:complete